MILFQLSPILSHWGLKKKMLKASLRKKRGSEGGEKPNLVGVNVVGLWRSQRGRQLERPKDLALPSCFRLLFFSFHARLE